MENRSCGLREFFWNSLKKIKLKKCEKLLFRKRKDKNFNSQEKRILAISRKERFLPFGQTLL